MRCPTFSIANTAAAHRPAPMLALAVLLSVTAIRSDNAQAHSMYQSAVLLDFLGTTVKAELQLPVDRLSISFRQTVDEQHLPAGRAALLSYVQSHVHPVTDDNRPFAVRIESMEIKTVEGAPYLVVRLSLTPPAGKTTDRFTLNYDVITHEIVTHVVLVSIRTDPKARIRPEDPLLIGVIRGNTKSVAVDRTKQL
jgi:hypothetical protein